MRTGTVLFCSGAVPTFFGNSEKPKLLRKSTLNFGAELLVIVNTAFFQVLIAQDFRLSNARVLFCIEGTFFYRKKLSHKTNLSLPKALALKQEFN